MAGESAVETRTCAASGEIFEVTAQDIEFYNRNGLAIGGRHFSIAIPTLCPKERLRRRLAFRNERNLYKRTCALSKRELVSVFSPDKPYRVVDNTLWRDQDNTQFGRPFDFNRPFFEQFFQLYRDTYKPHVIHTGEVTNSDYTHFAGWIKNCYLAFDLGHSEDCLYCVDIGRSRNCVDCFIALHSERCYDCVKIVQCYELFFGIRSRNCSFSAFLDDCVGCRRCLGCVGLRNQELAIFNQPVSEADFRTYWEKVFDGTQRSLERFRREFEQFARQQNVSSDYNINCEDCSGRYLENCVNVTASSNCFEARNLKHCRECYFNATDSYDVNNWGEQMQFCYELSGCGGQKGKAELNNCLWSMYLFYGGYEIAYSINCVDVCKHLFGCADLAKREYCILNQQYTPAEYNQLLPRIIEHMQNTGEWGEFFPLQMSPFAYNESLAGEYFPLGAEEVRQIGGSWIELPAPNATESMNEVADTLSTLTDDITERTFRCRQTGRPYRIVEAELEFYRQNRLPVPALHFNQRHIERRVRLYGAGG